LPFGGDVALSASEPGLEPERGEALHEAVALVALEDEDAVFAGAAGAAVLLELFEEGVEFRFGTGEAGDGGGCFTATAALVTLDAHHAVVRWGAF
jgi:hypothetical protein